MARPIDRHRTSHQVRMFGGSPETFRSLPCRLRSELQSLLALQSETRANMRHSLFVLTLLSVALGGCSEGVLNPKGLIAAGERMILFNSLGIMLAIVIPTILATLGVAFWFRASNSRASYLPD